MKISDKIQSNKYNNRRIHRLLEQESILGLYVSGHPDICMCHIITLIEKYERR